METVSTTGFRAVAALYRGKGGPPVIGALRSPFTTVNQITERHVYLYTCVTAKTPLLLYALR